MSNFERLLANQALIHNSMDTLKIELTILKRIFREFCKFDNSITIQDENACLEQEILLLREELIQLESARGVRQISIPSWSVLNTSNQGVASNISTPAAESGNCSSTPVAESGSCSSTPVAGSSTGKPKENPKQNKKDAKKKQEKKASKESEKKNEGPIDVSRLDLRVGKIVEVKMHPEADSLYVEQIDIGGEKPITVVSGLVKHVPLEEMRGRMVVVLCNLKPAKMRGVLSEAMVMCASSPTSVEVLSPPPTAAPGDTVSVPGYPPSPDSVLNPKKKIFEQVAPDLKTDSDLQATYKGCPWTVEGKGIVTTKSLTNVNIK